MQVEAECFAAWHSRLWRGGFGAGLIFLAMADSHAGQSQAQMKVSAYAVISGTISVTRVDEAPTRVLDASTAQTSSQQGLDASPSDVSDASAAAREAAADLPKTVCTSIVVSCDGSVPLRVNVDGGPESQAGGQCPTSTREGARTVSLCGSAAQDSSNLGVTIEY